METNNNEIILRGIFYNKVTTANEKIRIIKDEFGLSQKDLAGDGITTMCVSYIINGINGITEHSGPVLVKNINSLLRTNLTVEWLLEEPSEQVKRLLENNIDSYSKGKISLSDLEKIVNNNTSYASTEVLLKAYEILSENYINTNYIKASTYINRGIEISRKVLNFEKEVVFERLRGNIELFKGNTEHALKIYEGLKERTTDIEMKYKLHYNIIICLRKSRQFETMITEIEILEKTYEIPAEDKLALRRMQANSLACLKEYEKALEIHEHLLMEHISSGDVQGMCIEYYNIADIYFEKAELELAKKYISLRLEQKNDVSIVKHLLLAATLYNDLVYVQKAKEKLAEGDLNSLISVYNKELELCIRTNNVEMLKTSLDSCIKLSIKMQQPDLHLFMYDSFEREEYRKYLELFKENKCF